PSTYRALVEGPLRSRFELSFPEVNLGDKVIDVTHTITIQAGPYGYDASLVISDPTGLVVVIGLVDLYKLPGNMIQSDGNQALYTFGLQSENKDHLGMAIVTSKAGYLKTIDTDSVSVTIPDTYGLMTNATATRYRFYAGWEASNPAFKDQQGFESYLQTDMQVWKQPVNMKWSK
ncbi:MAG: DUF4861 family protein, partial [Bacteroidota bacterium]